MPRLQLKRGQHTNIPTTGLLPGEPMVTTDRSNLHIAIDATTSAPVTPAIDLLATLPSIDGTADLLIIHDASSTGQKEKKITFNAFKGALNIPNASTDEKVAIASGGTAGYIWGTDGTDGILRVTPSVVMTKDNSNNFVTLSVGTVDGGTF